MARTQTHGSHHPKQDSPPENIIHHHRQDNPGPPGVCGSPRCCLPREWRDRVGWAHPKEHRQLSVVALGRRELAITSCPDLWSMEQMAHVKVSQGRTSTWDGLCSQAPEREPQGMTSSSDNVRLMAGASSMGSQLEIPHPDWWGCGGRKAFRGAVETG